MEDIMQVYRLEREIAVDKEYDLVVAGGGPGGTAAAICAARLGAKVLLVEATGCLGGMGTSGLVTAFDPMADGEKGLVKGFMLEVVETMYKRGFLPEGINPDTWRKEYMHWTPFQPEGLKLLLDELAVAAGVETRFFTRVIDADTDKNKKHVNGVILQNVEGYLYVPAKTFIDATGDAILANICGATCREAGRDTEKIMPTTLCALFAGLDWNRLEYEDDPFSPLHNFGPNKTGEKVQDAIKKGYFTQPDRQFPAVFRIGKTIGFSNSGHIFKVNALRVKDLTRGMMTGRKIVQEYIKFYRDYFEGFENLELVTTASLLGVRETRRIVGEYELNYDDYIARRQFPDQIGVFNKYVDIHLYDATDEEYENFFNRYKNERLGIGECHGIPYSILVPKGWMNLWVAGRCNSSDVKVHGSIRVMPAAAMMGQAVGTAAVQSMKTGQPACDLDTEKLIETLRETGAYLPQTKLSKKMTR
jgi:hypothetical protein